MLLVEIKIHPGGDASRAETIRTIAITNVGPSFKHPDFHGYEVTVEHDKGRKTTWFDHRQSDGVEVCVRKALEALAR